MMTSIRSKKWQEQEAIRRFQIISPLLQADLDDAKRLHLRKKISDEQGISIRSLYRYEESYRKGQFSGLKPADRTKQRSQRLPVNFDALVEEAIQLRKEVPERSISQIILILEMEGKAAPGVLKRSTLERHLYRAGFGRSHLQTYQEARNSSSKRFCKPNRMMLIQADIKYGPKLPIGKNGAKITTYLSSAIDDHSRFLLHSRFYANQEESIIEDTFHQAILRYGKFDVCYLDNGSQYVARQLKISLSKLGIRIQHAPVRSGKSKGKVEKFHQVVDAFLREVKLKNPRTLEDLNRYWDVFRDQYYQQASHDGIAEYYESLGVAIPEGGISPQTEFHRDKRPLTYLDVGVVAEAFLHHEDRKVDKGACISFRGKRYETKPELIGHLVQISYDPNVPDTLTISHTGMESFVAKPLRIGEFCGKGPTLPVGMMGQKPSTSRFLDALEQKSKEQKEKKANAISFSAFVKGDSDHV